MTPVKKTSAKKTATKAAEPVKEAVVETAKKVEKKVEKKAVAVKTEATKKAAAGKTAVKKTAAKAAAPKAAALPKNTKVEVQFMGAEYDVEAITRKALEAYKASNKGAVRSFEVYIKPEEGKAYYVVNGKGADEFCVEL